MNQLNEEQINAVCDWMNNNTPDNARFYLEETLSAFRKDFLKTISPEKSDKELIADFMGWEKQGTGLYMVPIEFGNPNQKSEIKDYGCALEDMPFDTDWNWCHALLTALQKGLYAKNVIGAEMHFQDLFHHPLLIIEKPEAYYEVLVKNLKRLNEFKGTTSKMVG